MLDRNRQMHPALPYRGDRVPVEAYSDGSYYGGSHHRPPDFDDQGDAFNPVRLLFYVVQFRWLIALLAATGVVAGVVATMMQTPQYRATARLEVVVPSAKVFQDIEVVSEVSDIRSFMTAREKLKSRSLAQRVVYDLGLTEKADFLFPKPNFSLLNIFYRAFGISSTTDLQEYTPEQRENIAITRLIDGLSVDLVANTSLLSISFHDQHPAYAQEVANQLAQSFIDQRVDQTSMTSDLARRFIQEQVLAVKDKLQTSEQALVDYAKKAGITVTGNEVSLIASNLESINTALATAIQESLDFGRMVQQIDAGRGASLEQVLGSDGLGRLRTKIGELSAEYQQKSLLYKPNYPEMRQLNSQIGEMKRQLEDGITAIVESIRQKHRETLAKVADLRSKLRELEGQQAEYQDKNIQYTILKREVDSNRSQYESLVGKLNEVGVSADLKTQNAAIIDLAPLPSTPYMPRLSINVAIALGLFLALGAAIIYVIELLNNTFANPEQIEKELGLAVLGILPAIDDRELGQSMADPRSSLSEAYLSLRTSLQFSGSEGTPRSLLITSSEPSEGKSTTAYKLAQDFAALNVRVLVIDADLRKPNLHRFFGLDNTIGLSNLLTNTLRRDDLPKLLRPTKFPNVTVITSGTLPPNPADLLWSSRMAAALNNFAKRFDLVLVDAPPVAGLSDAPILSRLTEGTLLIVSANQVTRKSSLIALKRLKAAGANVVGAALSKFRVSRLDYNYAYKYMSYEYLGYGNDKPQLEGGHEGGENLAHARNWSFGNLARGFRRRVDALLARAKSIP